MTLVFDRVENIVGKAENADYQQFLPFPLFIMLNHNKALKTLVWHLSREPIKKKKVVLRKNKQTVIYDKLVWTNKAKD